MILFTLAFLAGDIFLQNFSRLPSMRLLLLIMLICFSACIIFHKKNYRLILIGLCAGFVYSAWYAHTILAWKLPHELENQPILITGFVASIPNVSQYRTSFMFEMKTLESRESKTFIQLSIPNPIKRFNVGDKWQLLVKLKKIHGLHNPGTFDYEAWAIQRGLRATGVMIASNNNKILAHRWYFFPITHFRQKLLRLLKQQLPPTPTSPWLMALIVGEKQNIEQKYWQILRRTGTNHLMAVAGLHIGMVAGSIHFLSKRIWRRSTTRLIRMPAKLIAGIAAFLVGMFYSFLAGFSIPAQRASVMLAIFLLVLILRKKVNPWLIWCFALLIVLFVNPLVVLTESFCLSFGTIALIIYGMCGRLSPSGWWWHWGRVQWVIGIGLIPFTLFWFHECSLIGFIANCIAIPWLSIFILPFCLLGAVFIFISTHIAGILLQIADTALSWLWWLLTYFSSMPIAIWQQSITSWFVILMITIGVLILLVPVGCPGRWLGLCWLLPGFTFSVNHPDKGNFWMTLLDVDQGLSVVVQTATHTLMFDTGARLNDQFDMGEKVLIPFLTEQHINHIDMLIISHGDNDHIGGSYSLFQHFKIKNILTSVPGKLAPRKSQVCLTGTEWWWDGVNFKLLHPNQYQLSLGNNSSCVLRITNGIKSVLITGDIEKKAEEIMLSSVYHDLKSDILIAPHHGSKTSGLHAFIQAVKPEYVLYATGYLNRYHFPHQSVIKEYQTINTEQLNTSQDGAIMFKISHSNPILELYLYKVKHLRYFTNLTSPSF